MADFEPTYSVFTREDCGRKPTHYVITTNERGVEFICTQFTHDKTLAEKWARDLRRAAQVEHDRKRQARGGR
jgi:hypothetical protein